MLEEDLALANNSLDLIGQARLLYQHVATVRNDGKSSEDLLAYFRDVPDFKNYTLLELPHSTALAPTAAGDRDYAVTIGATFSTAPDGAGVARSEKLDGRPTGRHCRQVAQGSQYHLRHARDWLVRLGDGTDESHARMQAAIDHLMPYTQEFWTPSAMETAAVKSRRGVDTRQLQGTGWNAMVDRGAGAKPHADAQLAGGFVTTGKLGVHSEHLGFVLAEMQSLARAHPQAVW